MRELDVDGRTVVHNDETLCTNCERAKRQQLVDSLDGDVPLELVGMLLAPLDLGRREDEIVGVRLRVWIFDDECTRGQESYLESVRSTTLVNDCLDIADRILPSQSLRRNDTWSSACEGSGRSTRRHVGYRQHA